MQSNSQCHAAVSFRTLDKAVGLPAYYDDACGRRGVTRLPDAV